MGKKIKKTIKSSEPHLPKEWLCPEHWRLRHPQLPPDIKTCVQCGRDLVFDCPSCQLYEEKYQRKIEMFKQHEKEIEEANKPSTIIPPRYKTAKAWHEEGKFTNEEYNELLGFFKKSINYIEKGEYTFGELKAFLKLKSSDGTGSSSPSHHSPSSSSTVSPSTYHLKEGEFYKGYDENRNLMIGKYCERCGEEYAWRSDKPRPAHRCIEYIDNIIEED